MKYYGVIPEAWAPLGGGRYNPFEDAMLQGIAAAHGKTVGQVILRWHIQMGFCPVPGSASPKHIAENADIFDFALTEEEMSAIARLSKHEPIYKVTPESLQRMATTKCNFEK